MPLPFIESQFPAAVSEGSKGGPGFDTTVFTSQSGFEQRNSNWATSRCEFDVAYGIRNKEDLDLVLAFFYVMRGRATGFRFKDWGDYQLDDGEIGLGTGAPATYQAVKVYAVGSDEYTRDLKKIVASTVQVRWNAVLKTEGVHYTVDYNTGILSMTATAAQSVTLTCEFDVPVRFDVDKLPISWEAFQIESADGIILVEVKTA